MSDLFRAVKCRQKGENQWLLGDYESWMIDCSRDDQLVDAVHKKGVDLLHTGCGIDYIGYKIQPHGCKCEPIFHENETNRF